ncbi:PPOX class F420-dependent oxidoreductase [Sphaerisporangium rufum]|uniref:PPOX class F420-dependent oxidoreductase n=1 Tax=Sphaerisporangium rufum TaxID=1381558 RepID=A0A919R509_9ACTN|nr:PPOX class F420-dependent oxidoreductase [Sphaerisporangium rufum]GII77300.1 PPOX class F420-dependent oxidoreductase [Sphaerisporangium rufum]
MSFSKAEGEFLDAQAIGRLATAAPDGTLQNNPVAFRYDAERGTVDIGGYRMGATKKFRNIERGGVQVAFVVDDVKSFQPWEVRGIEIRGIAEALRDQEPPMPGFSREIIRIHPRTVFSWGLEPGVEGVRRREIPASA